MVPPDSWFNHCLDEHTTLLILKTSALSFICHLQNHYYWYIVTCDPYSLITSAERSGPHYQNYFCCLSNVRVKSPRTSSTLKSIADTPFTATRTVVPPRLWEWNLDLCMPDPDSMISYSWKIYNPQWTNPCKRS